MAKLAIVIVNYNSSAFLERCLLSIRKFSKYGEYEICVVDNASADDSMAMLTRKFPEVKALRNQDNRGFAAAVNQGVRATTAPFVLWLNPDSEFMDEGMRFLADYMEHNPEVGIVGAQLLNSDGSIQISGRSFPSYSTALFSRYSLLTRFFPSNSGSRGYLKLDMDRTKIQDVDWVSGACLLHRRDLFNKIGPLDENFFMYCEDVDFCLNAKNAGWKVQYHPGAKVMHHIAGSSRRVRKPMIIEHHKSMWRYYKKHYKRNPFKDLAVGAGILARLGFKLLTS